LSRTLSFEMETTQTFVFQLFSFVTFICLVSTPKCYTNHVFLATVAWLIIITQLSIIIVSVLRFQTKLSGIDFELLVSE